MPVEAYELVPPPAHAMIESLRGVGYSTEAAIADIVDNSIAARARNVRVQFHFAGPESWISVTDDGIGMSDADLRRAMTLGGTHPWTIRAEQDLGRFGLGLKTASFAQSRCLTVATKQAGQRFERRWDLDYIARPEINDWRLLPNGRPGTEKLFEALDGMTSGTIVLWQDLDRITAGMLANEPASEDAFLATAEKVGEHLGMVFHRFLNGPRPELQIWLNGQRVKPWDPFLENHPATEVTPVERVYSSHGVIELQGFVLPHKDRLTEQEASLAAGPEGWTAQQGFYVYRSRRMLVAGGWLGLGTPRVWTMEEPYKLARLSLEFPNSADKEWDIDVKKSIARPPRLLRRRLTDLADQVRSSAKQVFAHRGAYGRRAAVPDLQTAWIGRTTHGSTSYKINRDHPAVLRAVEESGGTAVEQLLRVVEETVPIQRIWLDTVENGEIQKEAFAEAATLEVADLARTTLWHLVTKVGLSRATALERLRRTEPFQNYPDLIDSIATEDKQ
jgi:hypothetical protein